jgi:hypothetical protein
MDDVYDLFKRGTALLEAGDFNSATVPLSRGARPRARQDLDPRGARARVLPLAAVREAAVEFEAVVERAPTTTTRCSAWAAR